MAEGEDDNSVRGRFVWHELMTTDARSAASFFTKVVGWKTQPGIHDPSYTMFVVNDRPMAGLMVLPAEAKAMGASPSWMAYIGTPDVDATARQATALGGKILKPPADILPFGRFAVLQDPQGAVFAAFTPAEGGPQGDAQPTVGDFSWHELPTTDWRAALAFYKSLFGWEATTSMDMGATGAYQMYGVNGKDLGGMFNRPGPPAWLPYIHVADAKKAAATVKRLRGQVVNGPMEVPGGGWIAVGLDLQGAMFAVHSLKPVVATKPAAAKKPKAAQNAKAARKPKVAKKPTAVKKAKAAKRTKAPKKPAASKQSKKRATKQAKKRQAPRRRRR